MNGRLTTLAAQVNTLERHLPLSFYLSSVATKEASKYQ